MRGPFSVVRASERRDTLAALFLLLSILAAHSILETARDALFLSRIPAERLPWMVLAIAAVSLVVIRIQKRLGSRDRRRTLQVSLLAASVITGAFLPLVHLFEELSLYGLYVWSGVLATLVLVHFWTLLGDLFSVTQAKRLFPLIGAGGVAGAIGGSAAAAGLARVVSADRLVLVSAVLLAVSALVGRLLTKSGHTERASDGESPSAIGHGLSDLRELLEHTYARRIAALLFTIAAVVTVADFLFKQTVAREVAPEQLAATFGTFYLVLNVASLCVQLLLVGFLTRRLTVIGVLAVLPLAIAGSGAAMLVVPSLAAAFAIKGADGALRYSLDKTARELLFVPLGATLRGRLKPLIDVLGSRGGRALASAVILGLVAVGAQDRIYAGLLVGLSSVSLVLVYRLRAPYLELFREQLRYGELTVDRIELDAAAIEALVAALDSPDDDKVIVALEHLAREGRARLVPALILHHPSDRVVRRALDLFADRGRERAAPLIARIMEGASERVLPTAIAARAALDPDRGWLHRMRGEEPAAEVARTVEAVLLALGELEAPEAGRALERLLDEGPAAAKEAFLRTVERTRAGGFGEALAALALEDDESIRIAAGRAMGALGDVAHLSSLLGLLGREGTRPTAIASLRSFGPRGFDALKGALEDEALPESVRWHVPAALAALSPREAAGYLLGRLPEEPDGMVRYRTIRALELIARDLPDVRFDRGRLDDAIRAAVERAYATIDDRRTLARGAEEDPSRDTEGHELLASMIESRHDNAVGRLLRLLKLLHPYEELPRIKRGLASDDPQTFGSSIELLENILRSPLREAVVGLVDRQLGDDERLAAGSAYHEPRRRGYEELLAELLESGSKVVRAAAAHHVGELRLSALAEGLAPLAEDPDLAPDVAWSRARLDGEGAALAG